MGYADGADRYLEMKDGFHGGHIGTCVSAAAQREMPKRIAQWLKARDGSDR